MAQASRSIQYSSEGCHAWASKKSHFSGFLLSTSATFISSTSNPLHEMEYRPGEGSWQDMLVFWAAPDVRVKDLRVFVNGPEEAVHDQLEIEFDEGLTMGQVVEKYLR